MAQKTVYVRVDLKVGVESFYRIGIKFEREWIKLDLDAATVAYLQEEQMLEVSTTVPADYVAPAADTAAAGVVVPTDTAERQAAIIAAIATLDKSDAALWRKDGAPNIPAIVAVTGWDVAAAERDTAWAEINKAQA